jgi:hypothetical protein
MGLCGNNDGDSVNDQTNADGIPSDLKSFGDSFRDTTCALLAPPNQSRKPCSTQSTLAESSTEMCKWVGHTDIFGQCNTLIDWAIYRRDCEYDMCSRDDASDNTPMCNMVSALAYACKKAGIDVKWFENEDLMRICHSKCCYGLLFLRMVLHIVNCFFSFALSALLSANLNSISNCPSVPKIFL